MEPNIIKNIENRIQILLTDLIADLDKSIHAMKAEHSARGLLKSGATVKRVMSDINQIVEKYYGEVLAHIKTLPISYSGELEKDISDLVNKGLNIVTAPAYKRLEEITVFVGKPDLYKQMLPVVERETEKSNLRFKNLLNVFTMELRELNKTSTTNKILVAIELICLLVMAFLGSLWAKDPAGNYEPYVVVLGIGISILEIYRRFFAGK